MKEQRMKTAVALHYDGESAPILSAKGRGELAERIIEMARENEVPLKEDAALSAMLAQLDLGEQIPEELYMAVAEVLAFVYWVTGRLPEGYLPPEQEKPQKSARQRLLDALGPQDTQGS